MPQLTLSGRHDTWLGWIVAHLAAHPFAAIVAVFVLSAVLKGAGFSLGAPRPVAKRFLTKREQAMLVKLDRPAHCRIPCPAYFADPALAERQRERPSSRKRLSRLSLGLRSGSSSSFAQVRRLGNPARSQSGATH